MLDVGEIHSVAAAATHNLAAALAGEHASVAIVVLGVIQGSIRRSNYLCLGPSVHPRKVVEHHSLSKSFIQSPTLKVDTAGGGIKNSYTMSDNASK